MKNRLMVWAVMSFYSIAQCQAAVRQVETTERAITPIYLGLGRSTVLRFDERPKKVILGNANYFNVEYIENDLAIQPTANVTTNLFVYGESHIYGFSLHVGSPSGADDLVRVSWMIPRERRAVQQARDLFVRAISKRGSLGSHLQFRLTKLVYVKSQNTMWVEIPLLLNEKVKPRIRINEIEVRLIDSGREIKPRFVCPEETIEPLSENLCRIFFPASFTKERILKLKFRGRTTQVIF